MTETITKSIDTICIQVNALDGEDFVEISRYDLRGRANPIMFKKSDQTAARNFLFQIGKLVGVKEPEKIFTNTPVIEEKNNDK